MVFAGRFGQFRYFALEAFEQRVLQEDAVQQCYRVSPGPDFCLVVHAADANVRNVKTFFSIKRSKFGAQLPLPATITA